MIFLLPFLLVWTNKRQLSFWVSLINNQIEMNLHSCCMEEWNDEFWGYCKQLCMAWLCIAEVLATDSFIQFEGSYYVDRSANHITCPVWSTCIFLLGLKPRNTRDLFLSFWIHITLRGVQWLFSFPVNTNT